MKKSNKNKNKYMDHLKKRNKNLQQNRDLHQNKDHLQNKKQLQKY